MSAHEKNLHAVPRGTGSPVTSAHVSGQAAWRSTTEGGRHAAEQRRRGTAESAAVQPRCLPQVIGIGAGICAVALGVTLAACSSGTPSSGGSGTSSGSAYNAKITYWFWGESDIPGITKWMQQRIALYEKLHPKVSIDLVQQSNTTIISSFRLASQSRTGPDLDTQWATMPTLTPAFAGDVTPISSLVPASETADWVNTNENTYKGQIMAMPLYLIGIPLVWNKQLFRQAGLNPNVGPSTWAQFLADCKALEGARDHAIRDG